MICDCVSRMSRSAAIGTCAILLLGCAAQNAFRSGNDLLG